MKWFHPVLWPLLVVVCSFLAARWNTDEFNRIDGVSYFYENGDQSIGKIINEIFQPSNLKTIAPKAKYIWLKIPISEKIKEWTEQAVLFTGSNETANSIQAYFVQGDQISDLGYCNVRLDAPNCPVPTLQYAFLVPRGENYQNAHIYLKIAHGATGINNEFFLMQRTYFNKTTIFIVHFIGFATGIFLLVAILSILFFVSFRENSFLVYGLFYLSLFFSVTINRGIWDGYKPEGLAYTNFI